nr:DUF1722 domain-containing protein [Desulfurispira natronophila]
MARSPHDLKQLGRLVATGDRDVFGTYRSQLRKVVAQPSHRGRIVNALQHMAGYFSPGSHQQEKWQQRVQEFLDGLVAEEELLQMLRHWQREQPREYISMQVLLWPYPSNLISK